MMRAKNHIAHFDTKTVGVFFLVVTVAVVLTLCGIGHKSDLDETYQLAKETESFLETTCQKYENYEDGNSAKSLQTLLDVSEGLQEFIDPEKLTDSDFLFSFIHSEHLGGVLLVDAQGKTVAQADMDERDSRALWESTLQTESVRGVLSKQATSFSNSETIEGIPYNYVVTPYKGGLLLCYESEQKPTADSYEFSFGSILSDDTFRKSPTAIIAKGSEILSTNNADIQSEDPSQNEALFTSVEWRNDALTKLNYDGTTYYGLRSVFEDYNIYLLYPASEVFSSTGDIVSLGIIAYLVLCSAILIVRGYLYKKNLLTTQKQLRIINAISATYQSTFLLHLSESKLEPINLSERVSEVFEQHSDPKDFLEKVCLEVVSPESRDAVKELMDTRTIAKRLQGNTFLGCDVKDLEGTWYSLQVIPQRYSEEGELQTVLVATRDITSLKQAEQLSYFDKLTGLRNRNYMESHILEFEDEASRPLGVVMADCNYLKKTNDTLGHTWGDTLLKRTADALRAAAPESATIMRIGGDEFLVVYPNATSDAAACFIKETKQELKQRSDETLTLSASFGFSIIEKGSATSFQEACRKADAAMYQEKQRMHRGAETA